MNNQLHQIMAALIFPVIVIALTLVPEGELLARGYRCTHGRHMAAQAGFFTRTCVFAVNVTFHHFTVSWLTGS